MRRGAVLITMAALLAVLAGCTGSGDAEAPSVTPAPSAGDAGCTSLLTRLPPTLAKQSRTGSAVPGTAVWGSASPIVLRCGVTPPGPSTDPCTTVNGIDWLFTDRKDEYVLTSYGRQPAVELVVPHTYPGTSASGALAELAQAVAPLAVTRQCVGLDAVASPTQ